MRKRVFYSMRLGAVVFLLFRFIIYFWRSTQEAIRGRFAKPLDWLFRCVGSNPTSSAKTDEVQVRQQYEVSGTPKARSYALVGRVIG